MREHLELKFFLVKGDFRFHYSSHKDKHQLLVERFARLLTKYDSKKGGEKTAVTISRLES